MPGLPQISPAAFQLGLTVLAVGLVMAWLLKHGVRLLLRWRGRSPSSAQVFGSLAQLVLSVLALAGALTIVFPSVKPVDVLGGVGILSIAVGIAFQTMLGNMFAGISILSRDRFRVGDQISVSGQAGTVTRISLSSTALRTFDGRLVILPNTTLHATPVTIQTGYEAVRTTVSLPLAQDVDLDLACRTALDAMRGLAAVLDDPAPQALLSQVSEGGVSLDLRFWSGARQLETREARHSVVNSVMKAYRAAGITLASGVTMVEPSPGSAGLWARDAGANRAAVPGHS